MEASLILGGGTTLEVDTDLSAVEVVLESDLVEAVLSRIEM